MNETTHHPAENRGSALVTVMIFVGVLAILTASILGYSVSERRANERQRLALRARNMAENVAVYASEQLTTKLYRLRSASPMAFMSGSNQIHLPPDDVTDTAYSAPADVEVWAGLTSTTGLTFIDPTDPANAGNPNAGLSVSSSTVPIIAKSTMQHPAIGPVTAYAEQDLQIAMIPLFQFAVFYNMDMEFGPGPDMTINGPVHTNGNLIARIQTGFSNTLQFTDRVTASGGFYANTAHKGPTYMSSGSVDNGPGGSGPLYFQNPGGTVTNIKNSSSVWRDHKYGTSSETATTLSQFKTFATSAYGGNLRTSVHGVTRLELPAIGGYKETDDPATPEDDTKNGRQVIEPPFADDEADIVQAKFARNTGLYIVVNPDDQIRTGTKPDGSNITVLARSYRCFLNTVNTDGSHTIREVVLPGQPSYGYNNNGTPLDPNDDTMYQNNLPNRYTDKTAIGVNQILRIPASSRACDQPIAMLSGGGALTPASPTSPPSAGAYVTTAATLAAMPATSLTGYKTSVASGSASYSNIPDAFFYDLRRGNNQTGYPWSRSAGTPYQPRPIAKIDFDMTRLRLTVERTLTGATTSSSIFNPNNPNGPGWVSANWSRSVLNASATPTNYNLGINYGATTNYSDFFRNAPAPAPDDYFVDPFRIYFAPADPIDPLITTDPDTFEVPPTSLVSTVNPSPWFDGVTVYIDSVGAEVKDGTRDDSGVRLWNGRGPAISLDGAIYPNRTGFSFATNDALYVVGHFNADGSINSTTSSTGTGGYSGRYPESANEKLTSAMGDAITILSQPVFTSSGGNYYQTTGWADSLSGSRCDGRSGHSSSWATTNPSSSNTTDGTNTSITAASGPYFSDTNAHPGSGSGRTYKFEPSVTEISACLLTGIVPTTGSQTSGGVHNFPRLQESWAWFDSVALYIRGSMVAMFQSLVATEPWSIRYYQGAVRNWGLHESLRDPNHDIPLEPIVLNAQRMRYREITAAEYAAQKAVIEALPH
ncbi:MAG: hypothetical protein PHE83_09055 [Opitutaceae bacterium]|nr:hypothetical protein [Opitutaceae bacterium]